MGVNLTDFDLCAPPFLDIQRFTDDDGGFVEGRLCQQIGVDRVCCLPCPMTDWVYPDSFGTMTTVANWVATTSVIFCVFLLLSWTILPVDKTGRHYLSVCLTGAVLLMNLGFVIPLAAQPDECYNEITPHNMHTSTVCGASGTFLLLGGWAGVMWAFLRSLSLHLQICWQVLVGRNFMIFAQAAGWGVPIIGIALALTFSGVSFRFGPTCHINHENSLADFWIPLLIFAGATVVLTFATFGYCVKVYLASLSDNSASTEGSNLPTYSTTNSNKNITPRQAYRRVRRVISLQWRGIAIVLIIIADVIFFSVVYVFQDTVVQSVKDDPTIATGWAECLMGTSGDKDKCLDLAGTLVINEATTFAVLLLLGLNGVWLLFLLGRWSMITGWIEMLPFGGNKKKEFVSADARGDLKQDSRSYEMLSKETSVEVTSQPLGVSPMPALGRRTPDYFGQSASYHGHAQSFSHPRQPNEPSWDPINTYASPVRYDSRNPLRMNDV
jgi:hypothetical protein